MKLEKTRAVERSKDYVVRKEINRIATLGAILRSPIEWYSKVDLKGDGVHSFCRAVIEDPLALIADVNSLCSAHASVCDRDWICEEDVLVALKAILNSIDWDRVKILKLLTEENRNTVTCREVKKALNCIDADAVRLMEEFASLGMATVKQDYMEENNREKVLIFQPRDPWFRGKRFRELLRSAL